MSYLENTYKYIILNNKNDNLYHNTKHIIDVYHNVLLLYEIYKNEYNLTIQDKLNLGVAALFHDFNHSGGKLIDNDNINIAVKEMKKYINNYPNKLIDINKIEKLIKITEFPYIFDNDDNLTIQEKIILDADICQIFRSDDYINIMISLGMEWKKDILTFLDNNMKYLINLEFKLSYCNKLKNNKINKMIKEVDIFIEKNKNIL